MQEIVHVIGAGLAGCEACWQLVKRGIPVRLYEMRPTKLTPAHTSGAFAELVCSNSLRSNSLDNAVGILKEELRMLDSLIIKSADMHSVPAGSALAVDRETFSSYISDTLRNHPLVEVIEDEVSEIPKGKCIIASGPLTSEALATKIQEVCNAEYLHFFDAAAPIVEKDSIDFSIAYKKSRYDKGEASYINCPMNEQEFMNFYTALIEAEVAHVHGFEKETYFEGCMPFEEIARRGMKTLLFGPLKPVGLQTDKYPNPYAVVQLRQDNVSATLYNLVGFQTHLKWGEQKRILSMIPGLKDVSIVRYGVMHRNTYLCAPKVLRATYQHIENDDLFFAGQICGVEGYVESCASGALAGMNMANHYNNKACIVLPDTCVIGSMAHYITHASPTNFQPMNANFGIMKLFEKVNKKDRKAAFAAQAIKVISEVKDDFVSCKK